MGVTSTLRSDPTAAAHGHDDGNRPPRDRRLDWLVVGLPALIALALCLYEMTTRSLWLDETATVAIASQHGSAFGAALARDGGNMLGYYALIHVLIGWFGSGAFVIRFPSGLFAAATVACTGTIALRLFGRRVAGLAGLLAAVSLSLVYWGQDARGYAAMVALVAASFLVFLHLLEPDAGWRSWLAYVVLTIAAVYAGLEAVLVIPAQLVALGWRRERWRAVISAVAVIGLCCLPLAVLAANRGAGQLFWVPRPSLRVLHQVLQTLTSSGLQPSFYTATGTVLLVVVLLILALGAARCVASVRHGWSGAAGPVLVFSWLLVPGVLAVLESVLGQSIFQPRYLLISLPAVPLLMAWTLARPPLPRALAALAAIGVITLQALQLAPAYGVSSEDWRGATAYVVDHAQPGDCIAFYPLDNRQAFRYYLRSPALAPRPILPSLPWSTVRPFVEDYATLPPSEVAQLPGRCGRVWFLASHEGRAGGPPASAANYRRFNVLSEGLARVYPRSSTLSFGAQGVVALTLYAR
jgi:mannosyltransferase